MKPSLLLTLLLLAVGAALLPTPRGLAGGIVFDDSAPDAIRLGNSFYTITLAKANGALTSIVDLSSGQQLSVGSRHGCLWGAFGAQAPYVGGCSYSAGGASRFSYSWDAAHARLSLHYSPDPASPNPVGALATLTASAEPWFDLQLQLENRSGETIDYVLFPSDLVFREADIQAAYLPVLPGVALGPAFFAQNRSYVAGYPGELFADFTALELSGGTLAIYAISDGAAVRPLVLGLNHDDGFLAESSYAYRSFGARTPDGATWSSPRVRLRVGQPIAESILAYRADTGLDQFPSLADKAGARYQQLVQSPLLKADATQLKLPFSQYAGLLAGVQAPGILHLVAFQPGGFDENHPDMLPPAAAWGDTAAMAAMMRRAQARGFLTMPYTNPTWWNDGAPTMQAVLAGGTLADVAAADIPGVPRYEYYGSHGGYVISPHAPQARQRLAQMVGEMSETLPGDLIFEDQVGARSWIFDHNPAAPDPTAYAQGWLDHTRAYSSSLLMTEGGWDRLAESELGFHGSLLLDDLRGAAAARWGDGGWQAYPIAALMLRDKLLLYQHNLAPETFTINKATLAWNLAFGYMLSYDLGQTSYGGGLSSPWLGVVAAFQREVLARYAGERMLSYSSLGPTATQSRFEHFSVVTNWSEGAPYTSGDYVLPPAGVMVQSDAGDLLAGVFTSYNGRPLQAGEHYLIEQRGAAAIIVRQPLGGDTLLSIRLPTGWQAAAPPVVEALGADGAIIAEVASTTAAGRVSFVYQGTVAGGAVGAYRVRPSTRIFLPIVGR